MYDVIVIGAGVIGCAVAQALSLYTDHVCVVDKESDLSEGTTKANSAIVHGGFDALTGTNKAKYNILGTAMYPALSKALGFDFKQIGSLVLCFSQEERPKLNELLQRGLENGVPGLRIVEKDELKMMEPNISENAVAALFAPSAGIVCPYGFCQALAENACMNGAEFIFNAAVTKIEKKENGFLVCAGEHEIYAKAVVNAAGVFTDEISNMAGGENCQILPRRGEYCVFDKAMGSLVNHTIFQLPGPKGKGVLITPTVDGNLLVGPSAEDTNEKENFATTAEGLNMVLNTAERSICMPLPRRKIITSFCGLRAHPQDDDFHIGRDKNVPGLYQAMGIESPGLSAAPAIGQALAQQIAVDLGLAEKENAIKTRKPIRRFRNMDEAERRAAIEENSAYGQIVCRCETVTEAEVVEAIHRKPGATTVDGVKRRTRSGMGRCQGGFCLPRVSEILQRELNLSPQQITKKGPGSEIIVSGGIACK